MKIVKKNGMMSSKVDTVNTNAKLVRHVYISSDNLEDNVVYAIPIEDIEVFTMTVYPSEKELKTFYQNNFVLDKITEDGYVFKKKEQG